MSKTKPSKVWVNCANEMDSLDRADRNSGEKTRKPPGMVFTPTLINHGDFNYHPNLKLVRKSLARFLGCHPTGSEISMGATQSDHSPTQFLSRSTTSSGPMSDVGVRVELE